MSLMPHITVGPGFPVVLGEANKQAKREEGLKKLNFKRVPKFKDLREYLKIFFVGGWGGGGREFRGDLEWRRELGPLRTPWDILPKE